eukprot:CAMPEP_0181296088 /NCGR_PEP_ID=MMETSP1101-20121128/4505_1 /TAXON_ID=46948 /ORGANISM="Rhodomonas abbreviata, Strain Caron Lab Isolate" /LENGTH=418 /DNA_ID=CAMNT_0023400905 /DNA_START=60 /DNA_END=1317 /DNA_ORIENTATION=-
MDTGEQLLENGAIAIPLLKWDGETHEEQKALDRFGFLFDAYEVPYWYYEILEMLRKFIMTGIVVYIYPDSPEQLACGFIVSIVFFILLLKTGPFVSPHIDVMQAVSLMTQAVTLFYGLMVSVQRLQNELKGEASGDTSVAMLALLILLHALIFLLPILTFMKDKGLWGKFKKWVAKKWGKKRGGQDARSETEAGESELQKAPENIVVEPETPQPPFPIPKWDDKNAQRATTMDGREMQNAPQNIAEQPDAPQAPFLVPAPAEIEGSSTTMWGGALPAAEVEASEMGEDGRRGERREAAQTQAETAETEGGRLSDVQLTEGAGKEARPVDVEFWVSPEEEAKGEKAETAAESPWGENTEELGAKGGQTEEAGAKEEQKGGDGVRGQRRLRDDGGGSPWPGDAAGLSPLVTDSVHGACAL